MTEINNIEPFPANYFDNYFRLNDNCFSILFDTDFYYKDLGFDYCIESIFFISYVNGIYSVKLFREIDQKIILDLKLEKKDNQVNLLSVKLETIFKYESKKEHGLSDIKDLVIFCLIFANGKMKDFKFDCFSEENKFQYAEVFKKLNVKD